MALKTRMRVNENGRVVIPASFRKRLGIRVGDEVVLQIEDDELRITTLKRNIARAQRLVRKHVKPGTSLVDELIAERREAARNE
jgi:AbrB family looped-hinge helix DNA binding protein